MKNTIKELVYWTQRIFLIITIFVMIFITLHSAYAAIEDNVMLEYRLNETTGVVAHDSLNNRNVTLNTAGWASGKIGNALLIDSSANTLFNTGLNMSNESSSTISLWFNQTGTPTSYQYIIETSGNANPSVNGDFRMYMQSGKLTTDIFDGANRKTNEATNVLSDNLFYNIIVVRKSTQIRTYLNGVSIQNITLSGYAHSNFRLCFFGACSFSGNNVKNAVADEIVSWSKELNDTEIASVAGGIEIPFTPPSPPCVANWTCNSYDSCNSSNVSACLNVTDNNLCNVTFNGTLSTYNNNSCVYVPPCVANWSCSVFGSCNMSNVSACINVTDSNLCNVTFNGTLSTYNNNSCNYVGCVSVYACSIFNNCTIAGLRSCTNVTDNVCNVTFVGNVSYYDEFCTYVPPPTEIKFSTSTTFLILWIIAIIIGTIFIMLIPALTVISGFIQIVYGFSVIADSRLVGIIIIILGLAYMLIGIAGMLNKRD